MSNCCDNICDERGGDKKQRRVLWATLWINALMFVLLLAAALWGKTAALFADCFDLHHILCRILWRACVRSSCLPATNLVARICRIQRRAYACPILSDTCLCRIQLLVHRGFRCMSQDLFACLRQNHCVEQKKKRWWHNVKTCATETC